MPTPTSRLVRTRCATALGVIALVATVALAPGQPATAGNSTVDGRDAGGGLRPAGSVLELDVTGRGGSASDASAVALNLTATETGGAGFATVYPCGSSRPEASTINYGSGATIANGIIAKVGSGGKVCIYTHARAHLVVDIDGYFPARSDYRSLTPARLLDTRSGQSTIDGSDAGVGARHGGSLYELDVTGRGGTASNAAAVTVNLTATETSAPGFATVFPCGTARPASSTINYARGATIANSVVTKVGAGGKVCIYTHARSHFVVDVTGYFPSGSDYRPLAPARLLDTRPGNSTVDGRDAGGGLRPAGSVLELDVTGRGGSASDASAVALNLTATETGGAGFATVYPCGSSRPEASTINYGSGATIANGIIAKVGSGGKVCIYTHARAHLVVDIDGYFPARSDYRSLTPARLLDTRPATATAPAPSDAASATSLELLNRLRAAHGVGPVVYDPGMSTQALAWSQEMSRSGFRHSGAGYAENIAWHSLSSMSAAAAATALHDMWVDSPGHYRNMLDPRWTRIGIGLHVDGSGWYGTHMFAD
ncbi:MAG: CAP domain-containing protein [Ilumatobacteraceae bacterium]|nr:CAP domain-containing protein [Ilumatobacteraceae bacterium]